MGEGQGLPEGSIWGENYEDRGCRHGRRPRGRHWEGAEMEGGSRPREELGREQQSGVGLEVKVEMWCWA